MDSGNEWIADEVVKGLMRIYSLGLDGYPAADVIQFTASCWVDAVKRSGGYEQRLDAPRFREAFLKLESNCRRWPAPAEFLEALRATPRQLPAITKQYVPADPERVAAAIREITNMFHNKRKLEG